MEVNHVVKKREMPQMAAFYIRLPRKTILPPSYHKKAYEIIFILSGFGKAHLNKKTFFIKKGDAILVKPQTWHSFSTSERSMKILAVTSPYVDAETDLYHN